MSSSPPQSFRQAIIRSKLLTEAEVDALDRAAPPDGRSGIAPEKFARLLVAQGKLTKFQADSLLKGHARLMLDDYQLLDRIGTGRMAGVYEAKHKLGMRVAVKILPPSRAKQEEILARFQRESQLAMLLDHPHVVKTYHAGTSDGIHYHAMEFLEGETLKEYLAARGKLLPIEAVRIVYQALQGLQHIHEKTIVHRDLTPENLMLVPRPAAAGDEGFPFTVKLLDIGLGRALFDEEGVPLADLTADGTVLGSPDYMAPEQARHSHAADVRSDIYSLGCVLYHALTGHVLFQDKNLVVKVMRHATEKPKPPDLGAYPQARELLAVLDKMLAKDPAQRFATPRDAARALEPFLGVHLAMPVAASPPPLAKPVPVAAPPLAKPAPTLPPAPRIEVEKVADPETANNLRQWLIGVALLLIVAIVLLIILIRTWKQNNSSSDSGWRWIGSSGSFAVILPSGGCLSQ